MNSALKFTNVLDLGFVLQSFVVYLFPTMFKAREIHKLHFIWSPVTYTSEIKSDSEGLNQRLRLSVCKKF